MAKSMDAQQAAALIKPDDKVSVGLGAGQPAALLQAMGQRDDWQDLQILGALLTVGSDVYAKPGVRIVSGFLGPVERWLKTTDAVVDFIPADFRRFGPLLAKEQPRVMTTMVAPPDDQGWCSLSLHAGGTVAELHAAADDPDRLVIAEASPNYPRTYGLPPHHRHALHMDEIDVLIESESTPIPLPASELSDEDHAIAKHALQFIEPESTLQTGIGSVPSAIAELLAQEDGGAYGVHSEMFTDGLMALHKAGKVANHKGIHNRVSITTFALGSQDLYAWLHENHEVAFLPVEQVNDTYVIAQNHKMVTINGAIAIDIHGQVVADTIDGDQFSGIGGAEDFVAGPAYGLDGRSLLCTHATATRDGQLRSRIVPRLPEGAVITTPRHQIDVVVTEYGAVELEGLTVRERGEALAQVAHPDFRDELLAAAREIR
jgi:acyl-CoA hydrolase